MFRNLIAKIFYIVARELECLTGDSTEAYTEANIEMSETEDHLDEA